MACTEANIATAALMMTLAAMAKHNNRPFDDMVGDLRAIYDQVEMDDGVAGLPMVTEL